MKRFKIVKGFRGGRTTYHATLPESKRVRRGCWEYQADEWGENTPGGHCSGWTMVITRVRRLPKKSKIRLRFNSDYLTGGEPWAMELMPPLMP